MFVRGRRRASCQAPRSQETWWRASPPWNHVRHLKQAADAILLLGRSRSYGSPDGRASQDFVYRSRRLSLKRNGLLVDIRFQMLDNVVFFERASGNAMHERAGAVVSDGSKAIFVLAQIKGSGMRSTSPLPRCNGATRLEHRVPSSTSRLSTSLLPFRVRPCAFFSMFLVTFFSPNLRGRAEKTKCPKKKKHWLSIPDYLTDKWHTELIVLSAVILSLCFTKQW